MYKKRSERKRSYGGRTESFHQYNAQGSPEEKEEHAKSDGFKKGGHVKRAHGGHVDGHHAKHHLGKRARGGAMHEEKREHRARGGALAGHNGRSPMSSAHSLSRPGNAKGSPGEQAPVEG